jgi:hypothetical protein
VSDNSIIKKKNEKGNHENGGNGTATIFQHSNGLNAYPHKQLCNSILEHIKNSDKVSFLELRELLYDILIYNYDLGECIWYIINDLIKHNYLNITNLSDILIHTYTSLQYYNNNYRPIYHLENYVYNLITKIHKYNDIAITTTTTQS